MAVDRFVQRFGPTPLGEVDRLSARTWALSVPRYVSRTVRTMYADAANVGLVDSNPLTNLRLPAVERTTQAQPPSMEQFRRSLEACTVLGGYGTEMKAMIQFAAWTGVRAGELQALRWEDVEGEAIQIRQARRRDGSVGPPKNGRTRTIAYLPPARVLDDLPRRPDPFVFHSPRGKALDQGSHFYAWREVRAAAGLRHVRWHDWRHFCATHCSSSGLTTSRSPYSWAIPMAVPWSWPATGIHPRMLHGSGYWSPSASTPRQPVAELVAAALSEGMGKRNDGDLQHFVRLDRGSPPARVRFRQARVVTR